MTADQLALVLVRGHLTKAQGNLDYLLKNPSSPSITACSLDTQLALLDCLIILEAMISPSWLPSDSVELSPTSNRSIFKSTTGFYFCDETQSYIYGPLHDEATCAEVLKLYADSL